MEEELQGSGRRCGDLAQRRLAEADEGGSRRTGTTALVAGLRPRDPWAGSEGEGDSTRLGEGPSRAAVVAWHARRQGFMAMGIGIPALVALRR